MPISAEASWPKIWLFPQVSRFQDRSRVSRIISLWLGFNGTSTLVGHFVSSPEKRRRDIEEIVEEMKERDREEGKMNDSEETAEIKTFSLYPYLLPG